MFQKLFLFLFSLSLLSPLLAEKDPKQLVIEMVQANGGKDRFYNHGGVAYEYVYEDLETGKKDVSIEKYIFDGEKSWAKYLTREKTVAPELEGEIIQVYDGDVSWILVDGKVNPDPQLNRITDFLRKTNYYWFAMMFKLLDPGLTYAYAGEKEVEGQAYDLVEVTFGEKVGDIQDKYVLFINQETKLVDQFLFTVMDFGRKDPFLMKVRYEEVSGVQLPTWRKYAASNWEGDVKEDAKWIAEISRNVKFRNDIDPEIFAKPK